MDQGLRILHISRDFPPRSRGGLSTAVAGMANAQVRAGHRCAVLSFDDYRPKAQRSRRETTAALAREQSPAGVEITRVCVPDDLAQASPILVEFAADIVHVHHEMLWDVGAALARQQNAPAILSVHTLQSEQNRLRGIGSTLSSLSQERALDECGLIHAPSQTVATSIRESDETLGDRIRVARLGCALWPSDNGTEVSKRSLVDPLVLYVGRFADINGFAELLDAIAELFATHSTIRAIIAGGLPGNPRAEKRWHRRWQERAGSDAERLHFCGWLSQAELSSLYSQANVLVVPSWFETFGQVLLEGILHGTPIVTTGAGALGELIDADTGLLIAPRSADAISQGVQHVLSNPIGSAKRAALARRRSAMSYRWEQCIGPILNLYREALTHQGDPNHYES